MSRLEISRFQVVKASMGLTARNFFVDPQWIIPSIIAPFVFTMVSLFIFSREAGQTSAVLLAAVLGIPYGDANSKYWALFLHGLGY